MSGEREGYIVIPNEDIRVVLVRFGEYGDFVDKFDGLVEIDEIVRSLNRSLNFGPVSQCFEFGSDCLLVEYLHGVYPIGPEEVASTAFL